MPLALRVFLIVAALIAFVFVIVKIRKSQIKISDSIFWFIFMFCLAILAIFPQIAFFFSELLGIMSPANFVFLCLVAILLIKMFLLSLEISRLNTKVLRLSQNEALRDKE